MTTRSARDLIRQIQSRTSKVADLTDQFIARIQRDNPHCGVLETFSEAGFRLLADHADHAIESDHHLGPLHGVPILVDDLIDVANMRTTYGCHAFSEHVPEVDSIVVRRLRTAGALFPGKTRTSELGLIHEESQDSFVCRSVWGDQFVSGGGASGSAVGVKKHFGAAAVALDVGGNVLLPAAFNGVFALVPSYGRIAHTPIYSHGLMFANIALVTHDAVDCALLLDLVAGHSEVDPQSVRFRQPDYQVAIKRPIHGLSVALTNALWNAPCDENHKKAMANIEKILKSLGCQTEHKRPPIRNSLDAWEAIVAANLFTNHGALYHRRPKDFGTLAAKWISNGELMPASVYVTAQKQIHGLRLLLREFLEYFDVLICPAAGSLPFEYQSTPSNLQSGDETHSWQHYASMCNVAAISGFPTAHLPMGLTRKGLPVGVLVSAKPGDEDLVLALCRQVQELQ